MNRISPQIMFTIRVVMTFVSAALLIVASSVSMHSVSAKRNVPSSVPESEVVAVNVLQSFTLLVGIGLLLSGAFALFGRKM